MSPEEIKDIRVRLEMSQQALAELVGVSLNTVNRWERGHTRPLRMARRRLEELASKARRETKKNLGD